jgi:hypothetical protein
MLGIFGVLCIGFGLGGTTSYYYMKKRCIMVGADNLKLLKKIKYII